MEEKYATTGTFDAKTEFFDIVIRSEYPPEHFCIIFFHKVPSKCGFIGGGGKHPPLQELIAQNPYRSRVRDAVRKKTEYFMTICQLQLPPTHPT